MRRQDQTNSMKNYVYQVTANLPEDP